MKMNPYRLVEYIIGTIVLAALATAFCVIITLNERWAMVGWIVLAVLGNCLLIFVAVEWGHRKRMWDLAHKALGMVPVRDAVEADSTRWFDKQREG